MKKWFWLIAIVAGVVLYISVDPSNFVDFQSTPTIDPSGKILETRGELLSKSQSQQYFEKASSGQGVFPVHQLLTSFDSQALIEFGEKFWIMPNSQVQLERKQNQFLVHVLSGMVKVAEGKANGKTRYFVNGVPKTGEVIEKSPIAKLSHIPIEDIQMTSPSPVGVQADSQMEKMIHDTFNFHQKAIEKCFIKHYTRVKGQTQSGKVWVRFNIMKDGKLKSPLVRKSDYQDEEFNTCITTVVSRVKMKDYRGGQVQVEFPIDIKLPDTN